MRVAAMAIVCLLAILANSGSDMKRVRAAGIMIPGRAVGAGALLITELYYDTPGDDSLEEWFELTNVGETPLALDGYKLGDEESAGGGEGMVAFPPDATIEAGQSIIVARSGSGFRTLFGFAPDFEIDDHDPGVPNMSGYASWATGDVALNNDGDELLVLDPEDRVVDAVSYGNSEVFMQPAVPDVVRGQSLARVPANCDTDSAADWQAAAPSPRSVHMEGTCRVTDGLALEEGMAIGMIQGHTDVSPLLNEIVTFEGVVTGLLEDRNTRGAVFYTLFVQDIPGAEDGDDRTSDAIAVFHGPRRPPYLPGDRVRVRGQVTEFFGFTEIDDSGLTITMLEHDHPVPPPVILQPPDGDEASYYEALEGMRVSLPRAIVVGPTFSGCGFTVIAGEEKRLLLRQSVVNPISGVIPVLHNSDIACADFAQVKVGDRVLGLDGPLVYHFDQFKIVHQFPNEMEVRAVPMPQPAQFVSLQAGEISIATFNIHDHFDEHLDTSRETAPVPAPETVARKEAKLVQTLNALAGCPTMVAIQEVETVMLLQQLAQKLGEVCGFSYGVGHIESDDARGIDLGLLLDAREGEILSVRTERVCSAVTTDVVAPGLGCPVGQFPLFSRPPLIADVRIGDDPMTVIVVHFKSKREGEEETRARRLAQAGAVAQVVSGIYEDDAQANIVVLGDFNDYEQSDVMALLTSERTGLVNIAQLMPVGERYTYNFGGLSQMLDTILLSPALAENVAWAGVLHVNADFPAGWEEDSSLLFRSSDHDVPLVVVRMDNEVAAVSEPTVTVPAPAGQTDDSTRDEEALGAPAAVTTDSHAGSRGGDRLFLAAILPAAIFVIVFGLGAILLRRWRLRRS